MGLVEQGFLGLLLVLLIAFQTRLWQELKRSAGARRRPGFSMFGMVFFAGGEALVVHQFFAQRMPSVHAAILAVLAALGCSLVAFGFAPAIGK